MLTWRQPRSSAYLKEDTMSDKAPVEGTSEEGEG
jgi:hypothetical protein